MFSVCLKQAKRNRRHFQHCTVASAMGTRLVLIEHKPQTERRLLNQAQMQIKRRSKQQVRLVWTLLRLYPLHLNRCHFFTSTRHRSSDAFSRRCLSPLLSAVVLCMHAKRQPSSLPPGDPSLFHQQFTFPLFYDWKRLELKCYRHAEILLHDLTGLKHHIQPGTRPSHVWEVIQLLFLAAGTHPEQLLQPR